MTTSFISTTRKSKRELNTLISLTSTFLGVQLNNPIVIASSPLTESADAISKCEEYGAGAVIAKSCSSTRIGEKGYRRCFIDKQGWWAASTFDREIQDVHETAIYLKESTSKCSIPIFASVSELTLAPEKWISTCKTIQDTGVSGIQLDLFYFENLLGESDFSKNLIELFSSLKDELRIPIFPKLNINLPTLLMSDVFKQAGIECVSILDSISLPAPFSVIEEGKPVLRSATNVSKASLFGEWQYPLTQKYLYELKSKGFIVCAGGGVQEPINIIELILLGASAVQLATSIILNGYHKISHYVEGVKDYMSQHGFTRIDDFQGKALAYYQGSTCYQPSTLLCDETKCIHCGICLEQAFCTAISEKNNKVVIDEQLCDACSLCVDLCPSKALYLVTMNK